jgi:magnesium-transporting ATPase (P-type)
MTFTAFVMFDMFNALACRHNSKPVYELAWNSNGAFLLALAFSLGGQVRRCGVVGVFVRVTYVTPPSFRVARCALGR